MDEDDSAGSARLSWWYAALRDGQRNTTQRKGEMAQQLATFRGPFAILLRDRRFRPYFSTE